MYHSVRGQKWSFLKKVENMKKININKNKYVGAVINIGFTIFVFAACTGICCLLDYFSINVLNFLIVYILGVLVTAVFTKGYWYSSVLSIVSVFGYNFFFTVPRFTFRFIDQSYWVTFVLMFVISLIISFVMYQLKKRYEQIADLNFEKLNLQKETEKEQMKATLLRSLSHDLRTPLTTIKEGAELILNNPKIADSDKIEILTDISEKAEWTVRLVENLLSLTRINSDNLTVKKAPEAVEEIIPQAVRTIDGILGRRKIYYGLPKELLLVPMDATLVMQAISNILNNAIKHTADNGNIWINVFSSGKNAVFRISNDGEKIKDADIDHIFEMYFTTGDQKTGSSVGIGLAICKLIISAHGGEIEVRQDENKVTFEFNLPLEEKNA
ncbi:MAG: DUF4118 domain-containing protein [Clostridia bacterium]